MSKPAAKKGPVPSGPRGGTTVLSERTLALGQTLTVIKGSIVDVKADAYVHPTNATFNLGGQVGEFAIDSQDVISVCVSNCVLHVECLYWCYGPVEWCLCVLTKRKICFCVMLWECACGVLIEVVMGCVAWS